MTPVGVGYKTPLQKLSAVSTPTHVQALNNDETLEQLTKVVCTSEFVFEGLTERVMSPYNAVAYNLVDRTHRSKLWDISLKTCGMLNVGCQVIRPKNRLTRYSPFCLNLVVEMMLDN